MSCFVGAAVQVGAIPDQAQGQSPLAVSRTSLKGLQAVPTTCQQCPAGCGIIAYLNGDRLVQILGNPEHPNNQGGICAKGISGINLANDPERLLFPLKRIGPRGKGEWRRISWDEAYHTLAKRLNLLKKQSRLDEWVVDRGQRDLLLNRFLSCVGITRIIDRPALKNWNRDLAMQAAVGTPCLMEDVENSRTILNFGANPYANHDQFIALARRLVQARIEKGARLITFDVRMSETAAKSDDWYPLRAGTDGILALAMARVIIDRNLADTEFLRKKTNTSLAQLKRHLAPYTLDRAAQISEIQKADIEKLAVDFATEKPSLAMIGGGVTDHTNGTQNARCVALLNWVVGNLDKKGGLLYPPSLSALASSELADLVKTPPVDQSMSLLKDLFEDKPKIDTYFAWMANPAYADPECQRTKELLKEEASVPFLIVMDTHMTETAVLADLVLPAATFLEGWGVETALPLDGTPLLNLRQPVVSLQSPAKVLRSPQFDVGKLLESVFEPRGEALEIGHLCLELSRRMGGEVRNALPFRSTQDFVRHSLFSIPGFNAHRDFEAIKRRGFWRPKSPNTPVSSKKPKISVSIALRADERADHTILPIFEPIASHQEMQDNEFVLTSFKSNLWSRGAANSKWAKEIMHDNRLWINSDAAQKMGLGNGDRVRVSSKAGSLILCVLTTGRIHPKSAAIAEGHGHTATGRVAQAKSFESEDLDTRLIWWSQEGNGVNPMIIAEKKPRSSGACHAYKDTVIKIEKL